MLYRNITRIFLFLLLSLIGSFASADEYSDVTKLIRGNQFAQALSKADQYLAAKPRDPQMRFLKGVIQSETGKTNDATATFLRLTEDYPELPEPHNNLAVLYANGGQFEKAKVALEMAIRTNPSYSTAHENLGDIYARMASQAYAKALQLDNTNSALSPKLALIRELFTPTSGRINTPNPNANQPAIASTNPTPVTAPTPAPAVASTAAPAQAATVAANTSQAATPQTGAASKDVVAAVEAWAKAWSDRNMTGYLTRYGKDFVPPNKLSRAAWEEERKSRIMGKAKISVKLSDLKVSVTGASAIVTFKQDYKADALSTTSRKTLEMVKSGEQWLITKEVSG